ncbi:hypothetical protein ECL_00404 [Enterobacter cloacae subsp. cloacae ATCC 13047]|uniref:Uncharacterized protein n=1 Tax=Enterobacter cloacae subsp. cloacae (strain ATCC 13047 / DSM 30054 / NBRC 13535 / NCTC 10005 / WDCM 00083 / NCDC 279-56) TaxID=716541 RepID=A0A0H3CFC2_ENTCC|nr:hypothetical protein ECL_00404 [Enterobacter cloacae subsp. cloacae ATCC 13047]KZR20058.1 hypothetical protein A3N67_07045 [Enterobacter hormaechei subsp. steigerwaltii]OOC76902.1 hypothetical protein BWP06_27180 [Enterobacter cloacae]
MRPTTVKYGGNGLPLMTRQCRVYPGTVLSQAEEESIK